MVADPLALKSSHSGGLRLFPQWAGGAQHPCGTSTETEHTASLPGVVQAKPHSVGERVGIRLHLHSAEDGHLLILQMGKLSPRAGLSREYTETRSRMAMMGV